MMNNTRKRIERIQTKLGASPCPLCGRTDARLDDAELREKAEALLVQILPQFGGDRLAALAAFREHAPTLSGYLSLPG